MKNTTLKSKWFCSVLFVWLIQFSYAQEIGHHHSIHHAFIKNKGQWPEHVLFKAHFSGGNLWVEQGRLVFHLQDLHRVYAAHFSRSEGENIEMEQTIAQVRFVGANQVNAIEEFFPSTQYYNFFIGNDSAKWRSNVHGYQEAILRELYTGIDLKLIEQREELKYEFRVHPNADPSRIQLEVNGYDNLSIDPKGNLIIRTSLGEIIERKPYVYQVINGRIKEVRSAFKLEGKTVTFDLGAYDHSAELVIDPILVFATYSGSVTDNFGMTATYGYDGTAYSAGTIYGNQYPTPDPAAWNVTSNITVPSTNVATTDAFISKYSADGTTMLWTTFIGGGDNVQGTETAHSLICDPNNNVYLYGVTSATDFPVQGGFQSIHGGGQALSVNFNGTNFGVSGTDIFVAKFSANGQNLLGSTYVGGSGNDGVNYKLTSGNYNSVAAYDSLTTNYGDQFRGEIMLDQAGNCLIASCTRSTDFPVLNAFQPSNAGMQDGVVFKMSPNLNNLLWSSYYGGSNNDACYSLKIDSSYAIVFSGGSSSLDLPYTAGGYQPVYGGGKADGFVVKLTSTGLAVQQATYLGMAQMDQAFFVEIDRNDNVFVLGQSAGGTFPIVNSLYANPGSSQFIIKLNPTLTVNQRSTVFGNGTPNINISPAAFLVDICGNVYVSGWGANILQAIPLNSMPVTPNAFQSTPPNGFDFYLLVLKRDFEDILYGTYLGGPFANEHVDGGTSRFDKNGVVYQSVCGGCGGQSDFPVSPGAWSAQNLSSNCNNLIFKFDFQLIPNAEFTADQTVGCATFNVTLDNFSTTSDAYLWDFGNGDTSSVIFNPTITYDIPGTYTIHLYVTDSVCLLTDTAEITIQVLDSVVLDVPQVTELCSPVPMTFTANSFGTANSFAWSSTDEFLDTLNTSILDSVLSITPPGSVTYYVQASNGVCSSIDSVQVSFISSAIVLNANDSICAGNQTTVVATNLNPNITFSYSWSPSDIIVTPTTTNTVNIEPTTSQYVYVTAAASNGCIVEDSLYIVVSPLGTIAVSAWSEEVLIPEGSTTTLYGSPSGYSYLWTPLEGVVNPTLQTTNVTVDQSTVYTFTVTDGICTKSDTVLVRTYSFICGEPYVYIPNAFTPNGDNENDILYVRGQLLESMVFRVFDRWGELVFETFERSTGWDGTFRGKQLPPDVYDWYLEATCIDKEQAVIKGNVTLMR
jgi:gliding motility-associated-like protein